MHSREIDLTRIGALVLVWVIEQRKLLVCLLDLLLGGILADLKHRIRVSNVVFGAHLTDSIATFER